MAKKENIVRYSADEIGAKIARGEDKTDWKRVKAMSKAEVERLAEEDDGPLPEGWESSVNIGLPPPKKDVHIRLDADILDWFQGSRQRVSDAYQRRPPRLRAGRAIADKAHSTVTLFARLRGWSTSVPLATAT